MAELYELDVKILTHLQEDGRQSFRDIAGEALEMAQKLDTISLIRPVP